MTTNIVDIINAKAGVLAFAIFTMLVMMIVVAIGWHISNRQQRRLEKALELQRLQERQENLQLLKGQVTANTGGKRKTKRNSV